jgi:hypothetical protein
MIDSREFDQSLNKGLETDDAREHDHELHSARIVDCSSEIRGAVGAINQNKMEDREAVNAFRNAVGGNGINRYDVIEVRDPEAHKELAELDENARNDMAAYEELHAAEVLGVVKIDDTARGPAHLALVKDQSGLVKTHVFEEPDFASVD